MRRGQLALALLVLAGCTMGPDYKPPKLSVPAQYRGEGAAPAPGGSLPLGELDWWKLYRDPALHALLHTALQDNFDLRIAITRIEQARAVLGDVDTERLPRLGATAALSRQHLAAHQVAPGRARTNTAWSLGLNASWELDLWGRLRRASEAARAELRASEYDRRALQITLIADVATAYLQLLTNDEQLEITRATLATREQFLKLTRAQAAGGVVSGLDVAAAEAQLASAQAAVPELERRIALGENALSLLIGHNPRAIPRGQAAEVAPLAAPDVPAGLPSRLLERRPDLRQAEQALIAANARIGAAKAALFPTISLTGAFGALAPDLGDLFSGRALTWSAGVAGVQPILDPDRNAYQVDLADARKREALLRYEKAVSQAFRDVADALVGRQKFAELERAETNHVDAEQRAEDIATSRYRAGYSSYFDVINASQNLFVAELTLSAARLQVKLATVELYRALGGGWQVPAESGEPEAADQGPR